MALYGYDVPYSKKAVDVERRAKIFDIISPYCLSQSDLKELSQYPENIREMWLQTFTNSQKVMVMSKLLMYTKDDFLGFFPSKASLPSTDLGQMVGLGPGESILHRYNA